MVGDGADFTHRSLLCAVGEAADSLRRLLLRAFSVRALSRVLFRFMLFDERVVGVVVGGDEANVKDRVDMAVLAGSYRTRVGYGTVKKITASWATV